MKTIVTVIALSAFSLVSFHEKHELKSSQSFKNANEMEHVVKKSITIKAKPEEVWDALTNPDKTEKYFFNCRVISDWKAGSPITFKGKIFLIKKVEMTGKIVVIEPNKRLKYTLENGSDESKTTSTVTDVLTYANGETTVTVTDDVGQGEGAEKRFKRSEKGWDKILKGLKETVEEGKEESK